MDKFLEKILDLIPLNIVKKNKKLLIQIAKFVVVGGLAFVIDAGVGVFCKNVLHLSTLICSTLGFTVSVIFNYILSILWVFDVNKEKSSTKNFILFIVFSVIGLILTNIIMVLGVDVLKFSYLLIKVVATLIVMVFNFITRKLFLE